MNTPRTGGRRVGLLLVALGIGFGPGCGDDPPTAPGSDYPETYETSESHGLDLTGVGLLVAESLNGTVTVTGSDGAGGSLEVHKTVRAATMAQAEEIAGLIDIVVETAGDQLTIHAVYPQPWPDAQMEIDFDLVVPAGLDLDLGVTNGVVRAQGMSGTITAAAVNGQVDVLVADSADEPVTADAVNGIITVSLPDNGTWSVTANTITGCIAGTLGGETVNQCQAGPQAITMGEPGGIPCELSVVNGTIEVNR
jgi:DUF4097 and DUF4098 domain-containing protein YvlB